MGEKGLILFPRPQPEPKDAPADGVRRRRRGYSDALRGQGAAAWEQPDQEAPPAGLNHSLYLYWQL